jgi:hypothetical protein
VEIRAQRAVADRSQKDREATGPSPTINEFAGDHARAWPLQLPRDRRGTSGRAAIGPVTREQN